MPARSRIKARLRETSSTRPWPTFPQPSRPSLYWRTAIFFGRDAACLSDIIRSVAARCGHSGDGARPVSTLRLVLPASYRWHQKHFVSILGCDARDTQDEDVYLDYVVVQVMDLVLDI